MTRAEFRAGQGYDVHRLVPGRKLILGGVEIPFEKGLEGHSDADALLHALIDALLGAAGLGDIGAHFPDTDPRYRDADSRVLLREALYRVRAAGWRPVNVDATLIAQQPRLAPHIPAMRALLAADLGLPLACVNIKGKTNESLGYLGRNEAIEAQVATLLRDLA
jgi:2-C-methyl-D-erythritol 2,4-cyclodiphosphate synthase